jgi:hypothetical protein
LSLVEALDVIDQAAQSDPFAVNRDLAVSVLGLNPDPPIRTVGSLKSVTRRAEWLAGGAGVFERAVIGARRAGGVLAEGVLGCWRAAVLARWLAGLIDWLSVSGAAVTRRRGALGCG